MMERSDNGLVGDNSRHHEALSNCGEIFIQSSNLFLDYSGEVVLTLNSDGLSWKFVESLHSEKDTSCLGSKLDPKSDMDIKFSDVYAVEFINWGLVHESSLTSTGGLLMGNTYEMYRFTVHAVHRSNSHSSLWTPSVYTFGHLNSEACKTWVDMIDSYLTTEGTRPHNILVFVHPKSGKGRGCRIWETVSPLFCRAKIKTKIIVTERAGHARDVLSSITNKELSLYDGVVAIGGDGFFNEILNGVLSSRHNAPYPPAPQDTVGPTETEYNGLIRNADRPILEPSSCNEDESPFLSSLKHIESREPNCDEDHPFPFPNEKFRFGIIPAGSTDAIAICTTGGRDPVTSALHIILGKKVRLDIAQIVRWKITSASNVEPCLRYAASFAGYGFYGDVISESEKYRWMGPKRYDYAGTKVFLQHKSYEAEVSYLEIESEKGSSSGGPKGESGRRKRWRLRPRPECMSCCANCVVCNEKVGEREIDPNFQGQKWSKSRGRFISVGAAVISCRNEKAPDGLVVDAHLSDGFLHLILIKDCPPPFYLWHLIQLAKKGGNPLDFKFVEHHKTPAFTFKSFGKEGVWNLDGEIFEAQQLSAQVFRGLISLFATGPNS